MVNRASGGIERSIMQMIHLRTLHPKRDTLLLAGALPRTAVLHGWGQSVSILAIIFFADRLLSAWSWKRRITLARQAVQERLPQLIILP